MGLKIKRYKKEIKRSEGNKIIYNKYVNDIILDRTKCCLMIKLINVYDIIRLQHLLYCFILRMIDLF